VSHRRKCTLEPRQQSVRPTKGSVPVAVLLADVRIRVWVQAGLAPVLRDEDIELLRPFAFPRVAARHEVNAPHRLGELIERAERSLLVELQHVGGKWLLRIKRVLAPLLLGAQLAALMSEDVSDFANPFDRSTLDLDIERPENLLNVAPPSSRAASTPWACSTSAHTFAA
jgi:hypothetical protein